MYYITAVRSSKCFYVFSFVTSVYLPIKLLLLLHLLLPDIPRAYIRKKFLFGIQIGSFVSTATDHRNSVEFRLIESMCIRSICIPCRNGETVSSFRRVKRQQRCARTRNCCSGIFSGIYMYISGLALFFSQRVYREQSKIIIQRTS